MAFGQEFITGLAGALRKLMPLRVNRIEGGESWIAFKTSGEKYILFSWTSGASGLCFASQSEINALRENSSGRSPMAEALKSRLSHGGELYDVRQLNNDRILEFTARRRVSAGVSVNYYIVIEITEPVANFLILDEAHKIDEAARHSTPDVNKYRTILPGHVYCTPPAFEGIDIHDIHTLKFEDVNNIKGIGRPLARLIQSHWEERAPESWLSALSKLLDENIIDVPCKLIAKNNYLTRLDFSFDGVSELGNEILTASRHGVLIPLLNRGREKVLHEIDAKIKRVIKSRERHRDGLLKQLKECQESEIFRKKGEAILANIYKIPKRAENITLTDWEGNELAITLDPELTPSRNAEKYFKRYRKAKGNPDEINANLEAIKAAIRELNEQHALLEAINDPENFAQSVKDLNEWLNPEQKNYSHSQRRKKASQEKTPSYLNIDYEGANILVGLSAKGNRHVTFKLARSEDIWLHVHEMPGAHVIIKGFKRPELENDKRNVLEYAASLAALHSSGKNSASVPIDYTERKYIRSVPGTVALVTYTNPGTLRVQPLTQAD